MPFLGRTPTQLVDPEVDINGGAIDGVTIGATSASPATVTTFTSTGIDDNSAATSITINSSNVTSIGSLATKLNVYSDSTYSGIYNGSSLTSDEAIYMGSDQLFFYGAGSERMRINASGNVGIGTTSPNALLHVSSSGNGEIEVERAGGALINLQAQAGVGVIGTDSNHGLRLKTNGTVQATITTSGYVGIGTTSPATPLHVNGTTAVQIRSQATTGYAGVHSLNNSGNFYQMIDNSTGAGFSSGAYARIMYSDGAYPMAFYTNANERMRIDSSGHVGIGTTVPYDNAWGASSKQLAISGTTYGVLNLLGSNIQATRFSIGAGDGKLYLAYDDVNSAHRIVVDSAGKIGMGTSSPSGSLQVTTKDSSGADVYYVAQNTTSNRVAGYRVFDENGTTSLQMQYDNGGNTASIINPNNGSLAVYLGGTAAANALDDYEEGTWTPTLSNHGGSTTGQTIAGVYTKIGNICHFQGVLTRGSGTTTGFVELGGFPFTAAGTFGHISINTASNSMIQMSSARVISGSSAFVIKDYDGDGISSGVSGAVNICFQGSFQVA